MAVTADVKLAQATLRTALAAEGLSDEQIKRLSAHIAHYGATIARAERTQRAGTPPETPTGAHARAAALDPSDEDVADFLGADHVRRLGSMFGFGASPKRRP